MSVFEEYRNILDTLSLTERIEWIDDCRDTEVKLEEMKRIYGRER